MMKSKIIILSLFLVFSISDFSNAQIGGFLKSKAGSVTNRAVQQSDKQVDKKINNAVDTVVDNLFNKKSGKKEQPSTNQAQPNAVSQPSAPDNRPSSGSNKTSNDIMGRAIMSKMGISMERPANVKDKYDYTGNLVMTIQSWNENGETDGEVLYTTHYTTDNKGVAMDFKSKDKGDSKLIFDNDNQIMIILGDNGKDKSGIVMAMGGVKDTVSASAQKNAGDKSNTGTIDKTDYYTSFKKTGRTKVISGYSCNEYAYEDTESKASYWLTSDLPAELWSKMFSANMIASVYAGRPNGFIMEWNNEKKNTKEKSQMIVKEVNKNKPASISTMGYTFMSYGGNAGSPNKK
jgi:hypothetical protein